MVGQLSVLQERRRLLEQLSDEWCRRSGELESVLTLGERLYTHTGPLGRETVRANNMSVNTARRYEPCLVTFEANLPLSVIARV